VSLAGGEALIKQGVEGLRWQERMIGVRVPSARVRDLS
jgi:hypothetical protein